MGDGASPKVRTSGSRRRDAVGGHVLPAARPGGGRAPGAGLPPDFRSSDVVAQSLDCMQSLITRYRLAALPLDVLVTVPFSAARTLDFHRAAELIDLGRTLASAASPTRAAEPRLGQGGASREVEGDVDDHVLLVTDESPAADLEQDVAHVHAVPGGGRLSVAQEAGVDTGVPEGEGLAVDLHQGDP